MDVPRPSHVIEQAFAGLKSLDLTLLAALFWVAVASVMVFHAALDTSSVSLSTDDAMRLTEVRDLLAGQSWFDTTQHRMNTPFGVPMHWSRVIDAGLGGLILLFRLFTSQSNAEMATLIIWPILPLLAVYVAIARLGERLAGRSAAIMALVLVATCAAVTGYFDPGSIDHHNVHMALTLWGIVFLLDLERYPGAAIGCGVVSGVSLAIGLEVLPFLLLTSALIAFLWVAKGNAVAVPVRRFGLVFAGTAAVLLFGATATAEAYSAACDTYSGLYAALAVAGGVGLGALTLIPALGQSLPRRVAGFVILALILVGLAFAVGPDCFYGPYAHVDPQLDRIWLSRIEEVLSPLVTAKGELAYFFATYVYAVIGFAASLAAIFLIERENRPAAIMLCLFAALALAITTMEVRGMPFAILTVLPGLAATIVCLIARYARTTAIATAATIIALVLFVDTSFGYVGEHWIEGRAHVKARNKNRNAAWDCMSSDAVTQLATLPTGRVAAMVDQGPVILAYSKHAVIGGPYHRNARGILDTYDLFTKEPDAGANILRERNIDYLMICHSSPDYGFYLQQSPHGFLAQLDKGKRPDWLSPIPPADKDQKVQIYRVVKGKLPAKPAT